MNDRSAEMIELFSSIQGEGLLIGHRQIFLRFRGCNLECDYCDTEKSPATFCRMERTPGRRDFAEINNPVPLDRVLSHVTGWQSGWPGIHHSISVTGGEPLLNHEVLAGWLPELKSLLPLYLETNGVLHHALSVLIPYIDHISMDIKLPSTSGCGDLWRHHREFLRIAALKNVFVKTVVSDATEDWEISRACEIIAEVDRGIPLIIQPVTLVDGRVGVSPLRVLEFQEIASSRLKEVRIIPQAHKPMGLL